MCIFMELCKTAVEDEKECAKEAYLRGLLVFKSTGQRKKKDFMDH